MKGDKEMVWGEILLLALGVYIAYKFGTKKNGEKTYHSAKQDSYTEINQGESEETEKDIGKNYQKKWLLTYHEKAAYEQLKAITDKHQLTLFAKVRLFDLVEPRKGNPKYKTYMYKIQAKHVDFVICDQALVARYIIELDDNSHNTPERQKRDSFVDAVLTATGYKVLHVRYINPAEIEKFIS